MSSMSLAIVFLISSMITCFFFTLGRWVGKTENQKQKQDKTIECEWMYLKKENMYVKVPRDIADLINKMNKEKN